MKKELLAAVAAAALIAASGTAHAQSEKPMGAQGGAKVEAQGQGAGAKAQGQGGAGAQTQNGVRTQGQGGAAAGAETRSGQDATRTQQQTQQPGDRDGQRAGDRDRSGQPGQAQQPGQAERDAADRPGERQQQQTQQQTGDKPAQLSSEQRTKISSTIRQQNVDLRRIERTEVNFNITVGAVVPRTIQLAPLPAPVLAVVPAYRGYLYIVVGDDLLIIHPSTYEIVAVIPA